MESEKKYDVFHRTWWRRDDYGGRIPGVGPRSYIARGLSYSLAREVAREWNEEHEPGELSDKAELEES
jgi:hypothetical protein